MYSYEEGIRTVTLFIKPNPLKAFHSSLNIVFELSAVV